MPDIKEPSRQGRRLFLFSCIAATAGFVSVVSSHAALGLSSPAEAIGQWDMSLASSNRACRITLHESSVSMPAGCKRSLPILANVGSFGVPLSDHLTLTDQTGTPILDFTQGAGRALQASGPDGEIYELVAISGAAAQAARAAGIAPKPAMPGFQPLEGKAMEPRALETRVAEKTVRNPAVSFRPGDIVGRYAVLRENNRDTGCMVTLGDARGPSGYRANLAPACRDQGIVIFDPMGWNLIGGKLVLTARKGHSTKFGYEPDNTWQKDEKEGKPLGLKKF